VAPCVGVFLTTRYIMWVQLANKTGALICLTSPQLQHFNGRDDLRKQRGAGHVSQFYACMGENFRSLIIQRINYPNKKKKKELRKRNMPIERPLLVPNFASRGVSRGHRNGSPRVLTSVSQTGAATFHSNSPPIILMRLSAPRSKTNTSQKNFAEPGIEPGTSGSVARKFDQLEIVHVTLSKTYKLIVSPSTHT
jgi:hypothetical protein